MIVAVTRFSGDKVSNGAGIPVKAGVQKGDNGEEAPQEGRKPLPGPPREGVRARAIERREGVLQVGKSYAEPMEKHWRSIVTP